jgi:hypothetical protein
MSAELRELETRARAGDVEAQFALAVALDRAGNRLVGSSWLEEAGRNGHPEALAVLAVQDMQGLERPRQPQMARQRLERAMALGGKSARRLYATLVATGAIGDPDWPAAIAHVIAVAKDGDLTCLRQLARLVEMAAPGSAQAEDLFVRAGLAGDGLAGYTILQRHQRLGRTLAGEREFALWREGLKSIGHPLAPLVAGVTAPVDAAPKLLENGPDWDAIAALLTEPPGLNVPAPHFVSEAPYIRRFEKLLSDEECAYVIGISARLLAPAQVVDRSASRGAASALRTNSVAVLWPESQDLVLHALNLRLAKAAGLPVQNGEMMNILMYKPGEAYRAHFDFFPSGVARADRGGQRIRTLLVYLNADYDGGETDFSEAGHKIKGDVGDAVLFHNCNAATGEPDRATLHAGLAVTSGQKWLLSKWFRERAFVY